MKKVCFLAPAILGNNGFSTHITEVWKRMPSKLNTEVHLVIIKGKEYNNLSATKNLKIREMPKIISGLNNLSIKIIFYQIWSLIYCLRLKDLKFIYTRYASINFSDTLISKIKNIPLITEVNGIYKFEKKRNFVNNLKFKFNEFFAKPLFRRSEIIITVTDKLRHFINNEYGIPMNKISVINNGVDIELFHPMNQTKCREKLKINHQPKIVCFVGGFAIWQGLEDLVNSAPVVLKKVPNTIFIIIGSGLLNENLNAQVKKLKISEKVVFTGRIQHNKIPLYINSSDICVVLKKKFPIGYSPLKLYEYMACGKAVIGTNIAGLDVIEKNNAGITVNPENPHEVGNALIKLLKNSKLREQMGKNGLKLVMKKYTWEINAKKVKKICQEFI